MRDFLCQLTKLTHGLRTLCRISEKRHFSALASAFSVPPDLVLLFPKTQNRRREFANLLQKFVSDNPSLHQKKVHCQIIVSGFQYDIFLSNILLSAYTKASDLCNARNVFDKMPERNLVTWSTMVSMYTQHGFYDKALIVFFEFWREYDNGPNEYILASVIRACNQLGSSSYDSLVVQIHGFLVKCGFDQDVYVGTSLIDFYAKNEDIDVARLVFDSLSDRTAVTWTTMITGYVKSGRSQLSLDLFKQMRDTDVEPDRYVLSSVLSACSALKYIEGGKQIHCYLLRRGTETDVSVTNVLMDFYTKCCRVKAAQNIFDRMLFRNVISWTTMIAGYMQNSFDREAIELFAEMSRLGFDLDMFACTSVLTSCGSLKALEQGKQVHAYSIKANLENDSFVRNGLIDMYTKCDSLANAKKVFDFMSNDNAVSYNAMIEGYSRQEQPFEALGLFHGMRVKSLQPNLLTFVSLLGLSVSLCDLELSRQIHGLMLKYKVSLDVFAGSALIDVYSKCSCTKDARIIFEKVREKDIVVWNAMFSGYVKQFENEEALKLYLKLQFQREQPDEFTFASLVTAASNLASLHHGGQFHGQVIKIGLESNPFVTNALVDMYAKCGSSEEAFKTFSFAACRDVVCWNSLISCYANNGEAEKALELFGRMLSKGVNPNYVTFVGVLSACGHAGLVEHGLHHFKSMSHFGIEPGTEHYACIVSLLGRAGKVDNAMDFIKKMPIKPGALVWRSFLSACRDSGNVELAKHAAEMAILMDPTDSGSFVMLSNIYASKGMWLDVKKVRERMDSNGVVKEAGRSWVEVNNEVHVFAARDNAHNEKNQIYRMLNYLILQTKGSDNASDATVATMNG